MEAIKVTLPPCFRSKYRVMLCILLVLFLQLLLWIVVVTKPTNQVTIYLEDSELRRNQLEFNDAVVIDIKRETQWEAGRDKLRKKRKKSGFWAKLNELKKPREGLTKTPADKIGPESNDSHPVLQRREMLFQGTWSVSLRQHVLDNLEGSLFSKKISTLSDSSCPIVEMDAPDSLCRHNFDWECNHSPTYTTHFRHNRSLTINCPGDFRVEWYFERNGGFTNETMKTYTNQYSSWNRVSQPINIPFPTQYADVLCRVKTLNGTGIHHNYRTQFIPNASLVSSQRKLFDKMKQERNDWHPLSVLAINIDSLSRAQFHRSCGLPQTRQLLRRLFNASADSSHQAFLFNRLNSIGGVTAMNLTPLYAGVYFKRADEEKRVLIHRYTKPIKEWMWDYANQHGFLTSYAMDTGNGIMGTQTICATCNHLPAELPHWEHGWVQLENKEVRPGVLSGLCDGDTMIHEHIINYTRDFLNLEYPAKWAGFDLNAKHRPEQESANQVDALLAATLESLMQTQPDLAVFLFGDHGDRYHGDDANHPGSYMEILLPFLAIILPRHVLETHPEWERNMLINSQRYVVHYDLHQTMKSLMDYPHLDRVKGHIKEDSYNLLTQEIPRKRSCADANIPHWSCACGGPIILKKSEWTDDHVLFAEQALAEINLKHSKRILQEMNSSSSSNTTCMDLHFSSLVTVSRICHDYAGLHILMYIITFDAVEGPSRWELRITEEGEIESLKQVTRYQKYDQCLDPRVSIEFCVCHQFPPGTP
ncbi:uncharacterized protein [Diadema setosum]|uniref:uncharacterized protein n=1 Tax=Diadema setosum TaxID=31175 RepID=UPI003B3AB8D6